jgi:hypothetical protein
MRQNRRQLLQRALAAAAFLAAGGGIEVARKGRDLYEQHETWNEASRPNQEFFSRHASDLQRLTIGGSFAPEQWRFEGPIHPQAIDALDLSVRELGMRQMRLGIRWSRAGHARDIDLAPYRPLLDYSLSNDVELCLNIGPIRVFRWPEEHVPPAVLTSLPSLPQANSQVRLDEPLAQAAFDYLSRLLEALSREYGSDLRRVRIVQVENEPYFPLGEHGWLMSSDYMLEAAERALAAFPGAGLLVTSAGRLNLGEVRDLFQLVLRRRPEMAGRLISGFDFHYKTPFRDSRPVVRHFDQISYAVPFAQTLARNVWSSRDIGYRIEVTEGQAEPYDYFTSPGNSVRDFRFLILRCLDKVLDPQAPALIRMWGVEELAKRMLNGSLSAEHREIVEVIQRVNAASSLPTGAQGR